MRDGAVLANKKRVIQFLMIFYSFRVITDLMLMFVMFVTILFLNSFVPILDNRPQVYNYFFLIAYVLMSGVDFNILFLLIQ